jgi:hypothetical protein
VNQKNLKNRDDTLRQTIELLQRADEILGLLIEEKIPELINNKTSGTHAYLEKVECQKL